LPLCSTLPYSHVIATRRCSKRNIMSCFCSLAFKCCCRVREEEGFRARPLPSSFPLPAPAATPSPLAAPEAAARGSLADWDAAWEALSIVSCDGASASLPVPSSAVDLRLVRLAAHSAATPAVARAPATGFDFAAEVGGGSVGGGIVSAPASGPAGGDLSRDDAEALDGTRRLVEPGLEWSPLSLGSVSSCERSVAAGACFETLQHWKPANPSSASSSIGSVCCPASAPRAAASPGMLAPLPVFVCTAPGSC
jgi:hypothetical protein